MVSGDTNRSPRLTPAEIVALLRALPEPSWQAIRAAFDQLPDRFLAVSESDGRPVPPPALVALPEHLQALPGDDESMLAAEFGLAMAAFPAYDDDYLTRLFATIGDGPSQVAAPHVVAAQAPPAPGSSATPAPSSPADQGSGSDPDDGTPSGSPDVEVVRGSQKVLAMSDEEELLLGEAFADWGDNDTTGDGGEDTDPGSATFEVAVLDGAALNGARLNGAAVHEAQDPEQIEPEGRRPDSDHPMSDDPACWLPAGPAATVHEPGAEGSSSDDLLLAEFGGAQPAGALPSTPAAPTVAPPSVESPVPAPEAWENGSRAGTLPAPPPIPQPDRRTRMELAEDLMTLRATEPPGTNGSGGDEPADPLAAALQAMPDGEGAHHPGNGTGDDRIVNLAQRAALGLPAGRPPDIWEDDEFFSRSGRGLR